MAYVILSSVIFIWRLVGVEISQKYIDCIAKLVSFDPPPTNYISLLTTHYSVLTTHYSF